MYDPKCIANLFLDLAERDGKSLTPMKLQKLVYFAHGWHLAITGKPLLDEVVEAWEYGPVISSLYREFKEFGPEKITRRARCAETIETEAFARKLVERIWDIYGDYTGIQLSNLTHENDSPWTRTVEQSQQEYGKILKHLDINQATIKTYFQSLGIVNK